MGITISYGPKWFEGSGEGFEDLGRALHQRKQSAAEEAASQSLIDLQGMTPDKFASQSGGVPQAAPQQAPPAAGATDWTLPDPSPVNGEQDAKAFDAMHAAKLAHAKQVLSTPGMSAQTRDWYLQNLQLNMQQDVVARDAGNLLTQVHKMAGSPLASIPTGDGKSIPDDAFKEHAQAWADELSNPQGLSPQRLDVIRHEMSTYAENRSKVIAEYAHREALQQRIGAMITEKEGQNVDMRYARTLLGLYSMDDPRVKDEKAFQESMSQALMGNVPVHVGGSKPIWVTPEQADAVTGLYMDGMAAKAERDAALGRKADAQAVSPMDLQKEKGQERIELQGKKHEGEMELQGAKGKNARELLKDKSKAAAALEERKGKRSEQVAKIRGKSMERRDELAINNAATTQAQADPAWAKADESGRAKIVEQYAGRLKGEKKGTPTGASDTKAVMAHTILEALRTGQIDGKAAKVWAERFGFKTPEELKAAAGNK